MTPKEILLTFAPDTMRGDAVSVFNDRPEHLSASERHHYQGVRDDFEQRYMQLATLETTVMGDKAELLDLAMTVASAGEAMCEFMLNRALMNPAELFAAKVAVAEGLAFTNRARVCCVAPEEERFTRVTPDDLIAEGVAAFTPLFEDLERHAHKRFPHLVGPEQGEGVHV
jgi:hypothetical protein